MLLLEVVGVFSHPKPEATKKLVYKVIDRYGAFCELHSDQGTNFGSQAVANVCLPDIGLLPEGCLQGDELQGESWTSRFPIILMSYRATPLASSGITPDILMLGWQTRMPFQPIFVGTLQDGLRKTLGWGPGVDREMGR